MVVRDLLEYSVAVIVFQLVSIGIPGFVLAWRVGTGRPWLALTPVLMFAKITDCGHQALRQKVINGVVLGLLLPMALAVPASLNAREAAPYETGTTSDEVYWGLASTVSLVVCLGVWMAMWDGVCRATGQNTRKVWLFFVPLVNFAMPWVIALQAKRLGGFGGQPDTGDSRRLQPPKPARLIEPRRKEVATSSASLMEPDTRVSGASMRSGARVGVWVLVSNMLILALVLGAWFLMRGDSAGEASSRTALDAERVAVCAVAAAWRDDVQRLERASNTMNRSASDGLAGIYDWFIDVSSHVFPAQPSDPDARALVDSAYRWNSLTEEWLSLRARANAVAADPRATSQEIRAALARANDGILAANAEERQVNRYLVSYCGLEPIDGYAR